MNRELTLKMNRGLLDFIERSPSLYHVIDNFKNMLLEEGFTQLDESRSWSLEKGGKYFVTRGGSTIIAFKVPEKEFANFQIVASHSDSPAFKLKVNPEIEKEGHYLCLNIEKYGGMIYAPWFDRPLSLAGRVVVKDGSRLSSRLVNIDRDLLVIPNLAIHMNRKINDGFTYNPQKDMLPLFGDAASKGVLMKELSGLADAENPEDIVAADLYLYNRAKGTFLGARNEFIGSPRLDDLQCAYSSMRAFIEGGNNDSVTMCCVFDSEEVGSCTSQGADSTMLSDVLERISDAFGRSLQEHKSALAGSFMVSADNAHAVHPNCPEKADPTDRPFINHGVVIKHNANQKYTTDAMTDAVFKGICVKASVPIQDFSNRADEPGGSTLGNISAAHVSINMVDIGLPQLAMHSPFETAGAADTFYMVRALEEFYNTYIAKTDDGFELK